MILDVIVRGINEQLLADDIVLCSTRSDYLCPQSESLSGRAVMTAMNARLTTKMLKRVPAG